MFLIYLDKLTMVLLEMTVVLGQLTSYILVLVNSPGDKNQKFPGGVDDMTRVAEVRTLRKQRLESDVLVFPS